MYGTSSAENVAGNDFRDSPFGPGRMFTFDGFNFNFNFGHHSMNSKHRITMRFVYKVQLFFRAGFSNSSILRCR